MYIPKHFAVDDKEMIYDFIEQNGFCVLFSKHDGTPAATHLPLTLDRSTGYLYGHFAKPNSQWKDISNQEVLVVFQGPHHYISSSWYETNLSVPTWNYVAVHVYGTVELIEDPQELLERLNDLVTQYEDSENSYRFDEGNREFIEGLAKGIVGFRLKIGKMEGKWKLSQNHSRERQERVIDRLEQLQSDNAQGIARLMRENLNKR